MQRSFTEPTAKLTFPVGSILADLKTVYNTLDRELSLAAFDRLKDKRQKRYPKEIVSRENQLDTLLTFYSYSPEMQLAIYTSNPIKRMNKVIRKRSSR
ncbi:transposase [Paenibacillus sp. P22]|uniref:transposase n=1 Tax=Paenibacillus sp. P22 TaxID=483908 RepID=UPI00038FF40D|nr:hypothetical protein BN871_BM_00010 [Paenibacillus sp. P22]